MKRPQFSIAGASTDIQLFYMAREEFAERDRCALEPENFIPLSESEVLDQSSDISRRLRQASCASSSECSW